MAEKKTKLRPVAFSGGTPKLGPASSQGSRGKSGGGSRGEMVNMKRGSIDGSGAFDTLILSGDEVLQEGGVVDSDDASGPHRIAFESHEGGERDRGGGAGEPPAKGDSFHLEDEGYPSESDDGVDLEDALSVQPPMTELDDVDDFFGQDRSAVADETGKMQIISLMHKVYWATELEVDRSTAPDDPSGRFGYLVACRDKGARPIIPALMMMSGSTLLLSGYGMQAPDASALAQGLRYNVTLTDVCVSDNVIGTGSLDIASVLEENSTVTRLDLSQTGCGWRGGERLGAMLAVNRTLTKLDVRSNKIGDRACAVLFRSLSGNKSLGHLDLGDNRLGKQAVGALSEMLMENVTLTYLDLSWNHIRASDLRSLCPALTENSHVKALSLAWNGIGGVEEEERRDKKKAAGGGEALVDLIKHTVSLTELDVSNCRLSAKLCGELASALRNNRSLQQILLDGNPMGQEAIEVLKQLNARVVEGSIKKFSMDNCFFDPLMRVLDFDKENPSGYYRLDLKDPKDQETLQKVIEEAGKTKRDMLRNEKLNGVRFTLRHGGQDPWKPPAEGILELDVIVTDPCEPGTQPMDAEDFRFLGRVMEASTNGDTGRMHILKQACRAHYFDISQALMMLFKFGLDSSRESALVLMFGHLTDRGNLFVVHSALSDGSRIALQKRIGPLHVMNRMDPAGRYHFDLTKGDDVRAFRLLLQLKRADPSARITNVWYCKEVHDRPVLVAPDSPLWDVVLPTARMGQAEAILDRGLLELDYDCERLASKNFKTAMNRLVRDRRADKSRPAQRGEKAGSWSEQTPQSTATADAEYLENELSAVVRDQRFKSTDNLKSKAPQRHL